MIRVSTTTDLPACFAIRRAVFIDEQAIPEDCEFDAIDDTATHLLGFLGDQPTGTARVFVQDGVGKIGRVAVLPLARGTGLGAALVRHAIDMLAAGKDVTTIRLSAQVSVIGFYEKLGFAAFGPSYDDAGIPHRDMEWRKKG